MSEPNVHQLRRVRRADRRILAGFVGPARTPPGQLDACRARGERAADPRGCPGTGRLSGLAPTIPLVTSNRLEVIRTYWEASERGDWQAAGNCIGPGYRWIDHATGVDAQSPEELQEALADAKPWSNTRFQIEHAFETLDGALIIQAIQSCNITGLWRSMETTGQHVSFPICTIFKFDSNDRIVLEETYYDMLSITRQLGS